MSIPQQQHYQPQALPQKGRGVRVLSYNIWAIFLASEINERVEIMSQVFDQFDVLCLQEQFNVKHYDLLFAPGTPAAEAFPYRQRFDSAKVGSGLVIASRYPIVSSTYIPFRAHGHAERLWEGDYHANKGFAVARISIPWSVFSGDKADVATYELTVFNTHMLAQYQQVSKIGGYDYERGALHRMTQCHQLAQLISTFVTPGSGFVLCGDFNCGADSHEVNLLRSLCAARGNPLGRAVNNQPTMSMDNEHNHGGYLTVMNMHEDMPTQLDHVMYGEHGLQCSDGQICFRDPLPRLSGPKKGKPVTLSDHYGVCGTVAPIQRELTNSSNGREHVAGEAKLRPDWSEEHLRFAVNFMRRKMSRMQRQVTLLQLLAFTIFVCAILFLRSSPLLLFFAGLVCMMLLVLARGSKFHDIISVQEAITDIQRTLNGRW